MSKARLRRGRIFLLSLFIGSQAVLSGCNDDSKTSGTQIVEKPEAIAHRKAKGETYKGGPAKKQAKGAANKS